MNQKKWESLATLTNLAFEAEAQKMRSLRSLEKGLISQRKNLRHMNASAVTAFAGVHPSHSLSGDFHWQEWVGQHEAKLGIQQAQVRARIEILKPILLKAFGRKTVLEKLTTP